MTDLAIPHVGRRLTCVATLLALCLAMAAPTEAHSAGHRLKIVAPKVASAVKMGYAARVAGAARRVAFFVDGRRHWTSRTRGRHFRRRGVLPTSHLGPGWHRLAVRVRRRNGRVHRARHVFYVFGRTAYKARGADNGIRRGQRPRSDPEPEPEPSPDPAPEPSSDLLFDGSRLSSFDQVQAAPDAISEVGDVFGSGEPGFEFTVDDADVYPLTPTDNPRAQALSPSFIEPGDEIWLSTRIMFPADFPRVDDWMSLVSIYGPPFAGPSPWQIGTSGDRIRWQRNGTYDWDIPWSAPLVRGRWIDVLLHERFGTDGFVEMWIDGQRVSFFASGGYNPSDHAITDRLAMQTMDSSNDGNANHAKIMQYRQAGMFDSATVYFGALKVGATRTAVES